MRQNDPLANAAGKRALRMLELGIRPVVLPRAKIRGEHVDDHQSQVAAELNSLGLVLSREPENVTREDFLAPRVTIVPHHA